MGTPQASWQQTCRQGHWVHNAGSKLPVLQTVPSSVATTIPAPVPEANLCHV